MKTVYSAAYSAKYDVLFQDAFNALKAASETRADIQLTPDELATGTFTSLEEYYTRIGDLTMLHADQVKASTDNEGYSKYSKFLMLPLDEIHGANVFSIDSDSRAIQVPTTFARNGVSVTGDELAETLLFEIDRFFDITDLVTTDIYVQWTNPAGNEGASKITMIDYNSKPGKLLFGWPLTSKVTVENAKQTAGQLQFSIRFFKRDGSNKIIYSLNTLPATVTIKQALYTNWNDSIVIDDPAQELKAAISNGPASDGPEPQVPVYFLDLDEIVNLDDGALDTDKESATLKVRVGTTDSGVRDYYWYFKPRYVDDTNTIVEGDTVQTWAKEQYVKTSDIAPVAGKKYYVEAEGGAFIPYDPAISFDPSILYEPQSTHVVNWSANTHVTGHYWAEARNRVGNRTVLARSSTALIPCPNSISFTNANDNLSNNQFLTTGDTELNNGILRIVPTIAPDNCTVAYKWEYTNSYGGKMSEYGSADEDGDIIPASTTAVLETNQPGWYRAIVSASLNKEVLQATSNTCRVLAPIKAPIISPAMGENIPSVDITPDNGLAELVVNVEAMIPYLESDKITYTWYRNKPDDNGKIVTAEDPDIASINDGTLIVKLLSSDPEGVEFFYCVVTNELADKTASTTSALFTIV